MASRPSSKRCFDAETRARALDARRGRVIDSPVTHLRVNDSRVTTRMPRPSDPNAKGRLLKAAEQVFIEHGLERAKVEAITRAAGLSKGAFYLHFRTKDDAFKAILAGALAELGAIPR